MYFEIGDHVLRLDRLCAVGVDDGQVFPFDDVGHALFEQFHVQKLAHAECLFEVFVRINRRDPALGGTEFFIGKALLFEAVLLHVVRHGDDRAVGDLEVFGTDGDAGFAQARDLACKVFDVDDHAGAHHADHSFAQNARRQEIEDKLAPLVDDGVPRIVAALIAADDVEILGQKVDHAALALVSPVDADDRS